MIKFRKHLLGAKNPILKFLANKFSFLPSEIILNNNRT